MLVNKRAIRMMFKEKDQRVPTHFIVNLNRVVSIIVEKVRDGEAPAVNILHELKNTQVTGEHIHQAIEQLEKEGLTDKGLLFARAKAIACKEDNTGNATAGAIV